MTPYLSFSGGIGAQPHPNLRLACKPPKTHNTVFLVLLWAARSWGGAAPFSLAFR